MNADLLKKDLFDLLAEKGAKRMGVADLTGVVNGDMQIGISVAVPVPKHIVHDLQTAPTKEYYDCYDELNQILNQIVLSGAEFLKKCGYQAFANTTDVVHQDQNWCTQLPHKTVATRAGLGWIGKSCLLVTEQYGSAVRLSSLLTNAPLPCDLPITQSRCGECSVCVDHCPAKALTGTLWSETVEREKLFRKEIVNCKCKLDTPGRMVARV